MEAARKIGRTLLYEGQLLYPYTPSSVKNSLPPLFGVIHPKEYTAIHKENYSSVHTECLIIDKGESYLDVSVLFLQNYEVRFFEYSKEESIKTENIALDRNHAQRRQSLEREVNVNSIALNGLLDQDSIRKSLSFRSETREKIISEKDSIVGGKMICNFHEIKGNIEISCEQLPRDGMHSERLLKITVKIENSTPLINAHTISNERVSCSSLNSCHTILRVEGGRFLCPTSSEQSVHCKNLRTWPVLVRKQDDLILSSPIILYDYPEIAPESTGDLYESTEIEEYLLLHLSLLSEEEKKGIGERDPKLKAIIDQAERLYQEQMTKLHGVAKKIAS